jgi:hypothetical protein
MHQVRTTDNRTLSSVVIILFELPSTTPHLKNRKQENTNSDLTRMHLFDCNLGPWHHQQANVAQIVENEMCGPVLQERPKQMLEQRTTHPIKFELVNAD